MGGWKDSKRKQSKILQKARKSRERRFAYLKSILGGYNEGDIFNCDKTALFWK